MSRRASSRPGRPSAPGDAGVWSRAAILESLDRSLAAPGFLEPPLVEDRPEYILRVCKLPDASANAVLRTRLRSDQADAQIAALVQRFDRLALPLGWWVGPFDEPPDLVARLVAHGFRPIERIEGLALVLPSGPIPVNPAVQLEPLRAANARDAALVGRRAYELPAGAEELILPLLLHRLSSATTRPIGYLATIAGEPVGAATWQPLGNGVAHLVWAATVPDHRHQHVYSTLLARRLEDAQGASCTLVVTQARADTSAPILRRYGFKRYCSFFLYARAG